MQADVGLVYVRMRRMWDWATFMPDEAESTRFSVCSVVFLQKFRCFSAKKHTDK